ncbi:MULTISPECIES: hypothetical protein [Bordetella]|uniref:Secreted protein n=1 Tax=Bordetella petrii TaxID=94624 RepID=A0ABT7W2C7_9BORD|nr:MULTISPECIES: hypothetical protein [Bordetella]MDM9559300.1 hypothetical protein [Bordetella petrii]
MPRLLIGCALAAMACGLPASAAERIPPLARCRADHAAGPAIGPRAMTAGQPDLH